MSLVFLAALQEVLSFSLEDVLEDKAAGLPVHDVERRSTLVQAAELDGSDP